MKTKILNCLMLLLFFGGSLFGQELTIQQIRDFAVSDESPLRLIVERELAVNNKVKIDLFTGSLFDDGILYQQVVLPIVKMHENNVEFNINYYGEVKSGGVIISPNGELEVEENLRQIAIKELYPNSFIDYLMVRAETYYQTDWMDVARTLRFNSEDINDYVETKAMAKLIDGIQSTQNIKPIQSKPVLEIGGNEIPVSPSVFTSLNTCNNFLHCMWNCFIPNFTEDEISNALIELAGCGSCAAAIYSGVIFTDPTGTSQTTCTACLIALLVDAMQFNNCWNDCSSGASTSHFKCGEDQVCATTIYQTNTGPPQLISSDDCYNCMLESEIIGNRKFQIEIPSTFRFYLYGFQSPVVDPKINYEFEFYLNRVGQGSSQFIMSNIGDNNLDYFGNPGIQFRNAFVDLQNYDLSPGDKIYASADGINDMEECDRYLDSTVIECPELTFSTSEILGVTFLSLNVNHIGISPYWIDIEVDYGGNTYQIENHNSQSYILGLGGYDPSLTYTVSYEVNFASSFPGAMSNQIIQDECWGEISFTYCDSELNPVSFNVFPSNVEIPAGLNSGSALVKVYELSTPYSYALFNQNDQVINEGVNITASSFTIPYLEEGDYYIEFNYYLILDSGELHPCTETIAFNIGKSCTNFVGCTNPFSLQATLTDASGPYQSDGSISFGNTNLYYFWDDLMGGTEIPYRNNLPPGEYCVEAYDRFCCFDQQCFEIGPSCDLNMTFAIDATCATQNNGAINLTINEGAEPYSINWSDGSSGTSLTNLSEGTYAVTINDAINCQIVQSFDVPNISDLLTIDVDHANKTISGHYTGSPVSIEWIGPGINSNNRNTLILENIPNGQYCLKITTASGCNYYDCVTLNDLLIFDYTFERCHDNLTSEVCLSVVGGMTGLPYNFIWNNNATTDCNDVTVGEEYCVTISDNDPFSVQEIIYCSEVEPLAPLSVDIISQQPSCPDENNGMICIQALGGLAPIVYQWSTGSIEPCSGPLIPNSGIASITITDACEEQIIETFNLPDYTFPSAPTGTTEPACENSFNGSITVTPEGGYPPYLSYEWTGGNLNQSIITVEPTLNNVSAGWYSVIVWDQCGRSKLINYYEVGDYVDDLPEIDLLFHNRKDCVMPTTPDGDINLLVTGFNGEFEYLWSNGEITEDLSNVSAGNYQVTVSKANGCQTFGSTTVLSLDQAIDIVEIEPSCHGQSIGLISVDITNQGFGGPPQYFWSNGGTSSTINNLAPGDYTVTAYTSDGCQPTEVITVPNLPDVGVVYTYPVGATNNPLAPGSFPDGAIFLQINDESTEPYTYIWSTGATTQDINSLYAGDYSVTITNQYGCTQTTTTTVKNCNPGPGIVESQYEHIYSNSSGFIFISAGGLNEPLTYSWTGPDGFTSNEEDISGLTIPGTYCVRVSDNCGKSDDECFTLNTCSLNASLGATDPCDDDKWWPPWHKRDGHIHANPNSDNYFYEWADSDGPLDSGYGMNEWDPQDDSETYCVTITDGNGCSSTACAYWSVNSEEYVNVPSWEWASEDLESYGDRIYTGCDKQEWCGSFVNDYKPNGDFIFYPRFGSLSPCNEGGALYCKGNNTFIATILPSANPEQITTADGKCACIFPAEEIPFEYDYPAYAEYQCPGAINDDGTSDWGTNSDGTITDDCDPACGENELCIDGDCVESECQTCPGGEYCKHNECTECPSYTADFCYEDCGNGTDCIMQIYLSSSHHVLVDIDILRDGTVVNSMNVSLWETPRTINEVVPQSCNGPLTYRARITFSDCGEPITLLVGSVECTTGCFTGDDDPQYQIVENEVKSEEEKLAFKVYPNPFKNDLTILGSNPLEDIESDFYLTNSLGEIIEQRKSTIKNGETTIKFDGVDQLPIGIYFLVIKEGTKILKTEKLVKIE